MSVFRVTIEVQDARGEGFQPLEALVDIGATWTWIPRDILEQLGHRPSRKRRLQTAGNRIIERDAGEVPIRIGDEVLSSLCIFGDPGSQTLLGAFTLEGFSLAPDPVNERLVPVAGLLTTLLDWGAAIGAQRAAPLWYPSCCRGAPAYRLPAGRQGRQV